MGEPAEPCPHQKIVRRKKGRRGPLRCPDCHLANRRRLVRESLERNGRDANAGEREALERRIAVSSPPAPTADLEEELERRVRRRHAIDQVHEPLLERELPDDDDDEADNIEDHDLPDDDDDPDATIGDPPDDRELEVEHDAPDLGALDVDDEEVHIPPAIARRLAEAPVPAIRLKSRQAIAELERRGKPVDVIRAKTQTPERSPWERPREGFSSAMGAKHGGSILGPGWERKAGEK